MYSAKDIRIEPIAAKDARRVVSALHYSGKCDTRSQLHFGVFLGARCGGALQLGPPIDKRKALRLVRDTPWNGMLNLHRLALADWLPRNAESRCLAVVLRLLKTHYPHVQWVESYADATQSGDGAIYRASGFALVSIKENKSMYRMPDGRVYCKIVFEPGFSASKSQVHRKRTGGVKARYGKSGSENSVPFLRRIGAKCLAGFQLRYVYFLDPLARERLTVPILPFSEIDRLGARMYRGEAYTRVTSIDSDVPGDQPGEGGASPTVTLQEALADAEIVPA